MPRPEKPINDAGPVAEFAADLRRLRDSAGRPTYAQLAKRSHYSSTTLAAAASGRRLPSVDVVRAFVRACGAAEEEWTERWRVVAHVVAADSTDPSAAGTVPGDRDSDEQSVAEPAGTEEPRWRPSAWRRSWQLAATGVAAMVVLAVAWTAYSSAGGPGANPSTQSEPIASQAPECPGAAGPGAFSGVTAPDSVLARSGPSQDFPILHRHPGGCRMYFVGYCLGQVLQDAWLGTPDQRWYMLPDRTLVSSAVINGNPPANLLPARCDNDTLPPTVEAFTVKTDATGTHLAVRARGAAAVGFAANTTAPNDPTQRWRHVAFVPGTRDAAASTVALPDGAQVIAVACYAADSPSATLLAATVSGTGATAIPTVPDPDAARLAACRRPTAVSPQQ